jgi:aryl-alcohol dehydrogenase-like predicted oxidoreductase
METRPFGNTGEEFPILSFGAEQIVDEQKCTRETAIRLVNEAIDRGIRYFDTAWAYYEGQAERRLGYVAKDRREEMWIATKTLDTTRDGALRQLEESLKRLQTDYVDEWRLHNIYDYVRLDEFTRDGGALEAAIEAKEGGLVKHISISSHSDPQILIEALDRYPFESALVALSVLDHFILSFAEEFLPVANEKGVATIGMKVLGMRVLSHEVERSLRYAFSLPVDTVIVGMETMEQFEQNYSVAENFVPLTDEERLAFFQDVIHLVKPENLPWKVPEWDDPVEWIPRNRGR